MHHCHRNLSGLERRCESRERCVRRRGCGVLISCCATSPPLERSGIEVSLEGEQPVARERERCRGAQRRAVRRSRSPSARRGVHRWDQVEVRTMHPFGWFRAWTYVHASLTAFVAPRPGGQPSAARGGRERPARRLGETRGEEEFAGLRAYAPGIALKHMAWKVLARGGEPAVRVYTDLGAQPEWLEWSALEGVDDRGTPVAALPLGSCMRVAIRAPLRPAAARRRNRAGPRPDAPNQMPARTRALTRASRHEARYAGICTQGHVPRAARDAVCLGLARRCMSRHFRCG